MRSMFGGWTHTALATAAAMPTAAWAQEAGGGGAVGEPLAWTAMGVAAVLLVTLVFFVSKLQSTRAEVARLRAALTDAAKIESAANEQSIVWKDGSDEEQVSAGLARLIAFDGQGPPGYAQVRAYFDSQDAESLDRAVADLREIGTPFDLVLNNSGGAQALHLTGERSDATGLSILWVREGIKAADEIERLTSLTDSLRRIVNALPLPVWCRDRSLEIDLVNDAYAAAVELDDVPDNEPIPELAARVIPNGGRALAQRALETGEIQSERHHIVIGGSRQLVEISEVPLDGMNAVAGFALDQTEIENFKAELSRHIGGHEGVLQNLGTAIAIYAADERLVFFNNAFMQLWRLEESWLQTQPTMGEVLEELRDRRLMPEYADFPMFKQDQLKLFTSLLDPVEDLVHLPNGTTFRSVVAPHALGGLLCTWEDVTDALALERSYNTLIAVQRETLDHLYEGVAVIGGDGRLKLSNPAFGKMWQLPEDLLQSEPHISKLVDQMRDLLGESDDWSTEKDDIIGLLTDREPQSGRLERSDGSVLDFATVPLPDGAVLLSYLDVTDSNRVERALRERNEALETADRLKSEFIASVSYELRTPLNTIIGFAEILTGEYFGTLNDRQKEYSHGVLESSHRLLSLINNILDLATIEAGHMSLELDSIDLRDMLSDVIGLMGERMRKKRLSTELDCPEEVGVIVADERRLKQALFNILSNSIKFTPDSGRISVSARREGEGVRLVCTDTGIGIDEADRRRVFGKFERGSNPEARRSGAGLGLSLVKSFIELHGGHVDLESQPGVGTKVSCWLPARGVDDVTVGPTERQTADQAAGA